MKRLLICSAFVLISAVLSFGQCVGNCTSVTAALTDGGGQQWPNATVTILLVRPFSNPAPVLNNGVPVNSPVNVISTNGSGVFTISLDDTTKLTPSGAQWQFTMCPNASVSNCSQITTGVFGTSQNLTSLLSSALSTPAVNATPSLTRAYSNTEVNGSQGTLYWNTISNLLFGCNALPCSSNWVQIAGASGSFSSPPPLGNVLPNTVAASNFSSTGTSTQNIINASCISTGGIIDVLCAGVGATGDVKIQGIISNASACPLTIGCILDLRNMISTNDLLWLTNPVAGHNRGIQIMLGERTYIACQPIIDGQTGYVWTGVDAPPNSSAAVRGGSVIKAGTAADGCPGNFPNGVGTITTTWQHGPFPAGTYAALFNASGNPDASTGGPNPIATADSFGGQLQHILLDCNNLTTCTHNFFSATQEERAGLFDIAMVGATNGCGFWDRQYQIGPPSPGGSGPVHFEVHYTTCVPGTQATNNTFIPFAFEGNTTFIEFTGQSSCSATADPTNSGTPTAYSIDNGSGTPGAPVLTNAGNCTTPPTACFLRSASGGSGNVCALTTAGNHVATISFSTACTSCTYSNAQVPGGGPRFSQITIIGGFNGGVIQVNDAFAFEGDYNTYLGQIHTQNVHGAVYHHGLGNAPYYSGVVEGINATNGGDAGSTVLHCGVGSLDNLCSGIALQRLISTGNVVTDDPNGIILATGDTPSHAYIPVYPIPIPVYGKTGAAGITATTHIVQQFFLLTAGTATITLSGAAAYTSNTSYSCSCSTTSNSCSASPTSGSSITLTGTGSVSGALMCIGN